MLAGRHYARVKAVTKLPRVICCALAVTALGASACGNSSTNNGGKGGSSQPLTIAGWGGAIDQATKAAYADPYSSQASQRVIFDDAPGTQLAKLEAQAKAGKVQWDAMDGVAGDAAFTLYQQGLLAPLPAGLKQRLVKELGPNKVTDFGFSHTNVGNVIMCNMDKMKTCPRTMAEFYDTKRFPQDRMFSGIGPIMALATAEAALGMSRDDIASKPVDLDAAFSKLNGIKPKIKAFWTSGDQQLQIMRSGEVDMGIGWTGRAYDLIKQGMNIQVNWLGGAYEPGYWSVPKNGDEKSGFKFLEFIATHPAQEAKFAEMTHYSVPNPAAADMLPADLTKQLVDTPSNFEQLAVPNFAWYAKNAETVNNRYADFVRG